MQDRAAADRADGSERLARALSLILFAPVIAAPAFLLLLERLRAPDPGGLAAECLVFATIWPSVSLYGLYRAGRVPTLFVEERAARVLPFVLAIAGYLVGTAVLLATGAPVPLTSMMLCYAGNTTVFLVLSLRWKPSVHASGAAGPATFLTLATGAPGALWFLLLVPAAWARRRLGAHTWGEILVGAGLTVPLTAVQYLAYARIL